MGSRQSDRQGGRLATPLLVLLEVISPIRAEGVAHVVRDDLGREVFCFINLETKWKIMVGDITECRLGYYLDARKYNHVGLANIPSCPFL